MKILDPLQLQSIFFFIELLVKYADMFFTEQYLQTQEQ